MRVGAFGRERFPADATDVRGHASDRPPTLPVARAPHTAGITTPLVISSRIAGEWPPALDTGGYRQVNGGAFREFTNNKKSEAFLLFDREFPP